MGFTLYYRSTERISARRGRAIRKAAATLTEGRTWLSCEPVGFFADQDDGRLTGGSKPNFQPHAEDAAAAAGESLPDGTLREVIEVLCKLSTEFNVDWEFSHDHDPGPIGFIRGGVCEQRLLERVDTFAALGDVLSEIMGELEHPPGDLPSSAAGTPRGREENGDFGGPSILPFRPKD
jgi:hypothetical protein